MPSIDVDQPTFEKLLITAQLTDKTVGSVVKLLVERLVTQGTRSPVKGSAVPPESPSEATSPATWLPVHKVFKTHRIEGSFNPSTLEVQISTTPWSGKVFSSPTAAARAVVERFSTVRETSSTNGRKFWKLNDTGRDLRSLVGER